MSVPEKGRQLAHLALSVVRLRQALGYFLVDPRFTVSVGGNPNVVPAMMDRARRAYEETEI